jgi:hypothetical protein
VSDDDGTEDLGGVIAELYRGPLEEFVGRRDGLAKELRVEGRREEAQRVKALRKPTRTAWALNAAVNEDPEAVERCAAAVAHALEAQSVDSDVRGAYEELRAAVRSLAAAAAQASHAAGHRIDQADLVPAASAVIGDPSAFEELRAGRLVSIPTAGGLDRLTGMPPSAAPTPRAKTAPKRTTKRTAEPTTEQSQAQTRARKALQEAEAAVRSARKRAQDAARAQSQAERKAQAAEERLRAAEGKALAARAELDQARWEAEEAEAEERAANEAAEQARAELERLNDES